MEHEGFRSSLFFNRKARVLSGERSAAKIIRAIHTAIQKHSSGKIDYIACVSADSLMPVKQFRGKVMIALAVKFGRTRLIDNIIFYV